MCVFLYVASPFRTVKVLGFSSTVSFLMKCESSWYLGGSKIKSKKFFSIFQNRREKQKKS